MKTVKSNRPLRGYSLYEVVNGSKVQARERAHYLKDAGLRAKVLPMKTSVRGYFNYSIWTKPAMAR